jgi:hypothetical protein
MDFTRNEEAEQICNELIDVFLNELLGVNLRVGISEEPLREHHALVDGFSVKFRPKGMWGDLAGDGVDFIVQIKGGAWDAANENLRSILLFDVLSQVQAVRDKEGVVTGYRMRKKRPTLGVIRDRHSSEVLNSLAGVEVERSEQTETSESSTEVELASY